MGVSKLHEAFTSTVTLKFDAFLGLVRRQPDAAVFFYFDSAVPSHRSSAKLDAVILGRGIGRHRWRIC